jgi:hypothetical protein
MNWRDLLSTTTTGAVHDEEILNVIRRSDHDMLRRRRLLSLL